MFLVVNWAIFWTRANTECWAVWILGHRNAFNIAWENGPLECIVSGLCSCIKKKKKRWYLNELVVIISLLHKFTSSLKTQKPIVFYFLQRHSVSAVLFTNILTGLNFIDHILLTFACYHIQNCLTFYMSLTCIAYSK